MLPTFMLLISEESKTETPISISNPIPAEVIPPKHSAQFKERLPNLSPTLSSASSKLSTAFSPSSVFQDSMLPKSCHSGGIEIALKSMREGKICMLSCKHHVWNACDVQMKPKFNCFVCCPDEHALDLSTKRRVPENSWIRMKQSTHWSIGLRCCLQLRFSSVQGKLACLLWLVGTTGSTRWMHVITECWLE